MKVLAFFLCKKRENKKRENKKREERKQEERREKITSYLLPIT
jgi:hypothetical protein